MTKNEVVELLKSIDVFYPNRIKPDDFERLLRQYTVALAPFEESEIMKNLVEHSYVSPFLPTLFDLVKQERDVPTNVRSAKETQAFLEKYDNLPAADPEVVKAEQAKIRKILGYGGGTDE